MQITLCSMFRDSQPYLSRYLGQIQMLREHVDVRVVGTYGDCTDDTEGLLLSYASHHTGMEFERCDHGGPNFGSVDHAPRWDQIAKVARFTLDRVGSPGDALVWVESDLVWSSLTMLSLLEDLDQVDAVAPMVLSEEPPQTAGPRFYDIWGFRQEGRQFNAYKPYWNYRERSDPFVKIDSCGSCWVTSGDSWKNWSGHWPFTADGALWLDPRLKIWHP